MTEANGRAPALPALGELLALRTDYLDVTVDALGGRVLRLYALSGTARAILVPAMATLANTKDETSPDAVRAVMTFQTHVVAASLGYPQEQWDGLGDALGAPAIERLYDDAAKLSGLDEKAKAEAVRRLPAKRNAVSGTA